MKTIKLISKIVIATGIFCVLLLSFISEQDKSEQPFYYAFGEKVQINRMADKIYIKKKPTLQKINFEEYLQQLFGEIKIEWQNNDISKIELKDLKNKENKISNLLSNDEIVSIRSAYKTIDGLEFGLSDEIVIKFKNEIEESEQKEILKSFDLKQSKSTKIYESVVIAKDEDIIEVANRLYESGKFVFAYPDIICTAELCDIYPNDPYFQHQFALHNIGQMTIDGHTCFYDADIDAPEAWDITTGNSNVIVAVFDEGVTSNHPDLPNTRQVRLNGSNFGSGNANDPSPIGNHNHGNACAGVIGATMNNNQGIAGIAPGCKIMPLRFDSTTYTFEMADGIEFAVDNGANIISNSWAYNTPNSNYVPAIVAAIQYAINNNVVVVCAAGNNASHSCNYDGYVKFPANANIDYLLTVGASDRNDRQADYSPTSSLIDIVAPSHKAYPREEYIPACGGIDGETLEMWTLDIPGYAGYNPWPEFLSYLPLPSGIHPPRTGEILPGDGTNYISYTGRFGGTSHACPVVAGVAALILSEHPNMTPEQIFDIITGSADQIGYGVYTYTNGRSNETGFGRVNAYEALIYCNTFDFINQTISTNTTIEDCNINIQNVEVNNNSKLTINASNNVTINGEFEVELGSELEIP